MNAKETIILKILRSPITLFTSMALGIVIGQWVEVLLSIMDFVANIYMNLLQMCVLPIVICAVTVNIGILIKSGDHKMLLRWLGLCVGALVLFSALAVGVATLASDILRPDAQASTMLAELSGGGASEVAQFINPITYGGDHTPVVQEENTLIQFIYTIIPTNIFASLASGDILPTIFFFLALGFVLALLDDEKTTPVYKAFDSVYAAMSKLMGYVLIPFPLAMIALFAQQFSGDTIFSLLGSLIPLVLVEVGVMVLVCVIVCIVIKLFTKCTFAEQIRAIKRAFFIAIGTTNAMATVSVALEDAVEHLHIKPQLAKSVLPISISMCQAGVAASVAVAAVYGMLIYDVPSSMGALLLVIACSVIFSLAVIGVPGLVAVSMLTIVLDPLYIPSALIITIYLAIVPIINPSIVFAGVHGNFGIVSILNKHQASKEESL